MSVEDEAKALGIGGLKRHIFLCRGPECCSHKKGDAVWSYLKDRLKQLHLSGAEGSVYRSKADCLRICQDGPIVLVYPEGTWYARVDEVKMERIIQQHLIGGVPLKDEAFATNPLSFENP